jgi:hypothetical protein
MAYTKSNERWNKKKKKRKEEEWKQQQEERKKKLKLTYKTIKKCFNN